VTCAGTRPGATTAQLQVFEVPGNEGVYTANLKPEYVHEFSVRVKGVRLTLTFATTLKAPRAIAIKTQVEREKYMLPRVVLGVSEPGWLVPSTLWA
jgi:hypothetical protein